MIKKMIAVLLAMGAVSSGAFGADADVDGRPYEIVWANRTHDDHEPILPFPNRALTVVPPASGETFLFRLPSDLAIWDDLAFSRVRSRSSPARGASRRGVRPLCRAARELLGRLRPSASSLD